METNNPYDETQLWLPEQGKVAGTYYQGQAYNTRYQQQVPANYPYYTDSTPNAQTTPLVNQRPQQTQKHDKLSTRMSKTQAVSMARTLKRSVIVASITGFGVLSALVATHLQGTSTNQATSSPASQNTSSSSPSTTAPVNPGPDSNSSSNQNPANTNSGGYFNQQGGGYGFGNGGSLQGPGTSSSAS